MGSCLEECRKQTEAYITHSGVILALHAFRFLHTEAVCLHNPLRGLRYPAGSSKEGEQERCTPCWPHGPLRAYRLVMSEHWADQIFKRALSGWCRCKATLDRTDALLLQAYHICTNRCSHCCEGVSNRFTGRANQQTMMLPLSVSKLLLTILAHISYELAYQVTSSARNLSLAPVRIIWHHRLRASCESAPFSAPIQTAGRRLRAAVVSIVRHPSVPEIFHDS